MRSMAPHAHLLRFISRKDKLFGREVGAYLAEGLNRGHACLIAARPHNADLFCSALDAAGCDSAGAIAAGNLVVLDAEMLARELLVRETPSQERFDQLIASRIRQTDETMGRRPWRAYGEIVNVYWHDGRPDAALALEGMWNELIRLEELTLYCGYAIDVFDDEFQIEIVDSLLKVHGQVASSLDRQAIALAIPNAVREVLGDESSNVLELLRPEHRPDWPILPSSEAKILWMRKNLPQYAPAIVATAARLYDEALEDVAV